MRDYKIYLEDILESISKIEKYVKKIDSYENFSKQGIIIDAVVRNLQIIGEAVKNLPVDLRKRYSNVEWKKIAGFKDVVTHAYFGVDNRIIWDIVKKKLPGLKKDIKDILDKKINNQSL